MLCKTDETGNDFVNNFLCFFLSFLHFIKRKSFVSEILDGSLSLDLRPIIRKGCRKFLYCLYCRRKSGFLKRFTLAGPSVTLTSLKDEFRLSCESQPIILTVFS